MFKLALEVDNEIIKLGDMVRIKLKASEEPIDGTLTTIFNSVWEPHSICITLKEMKYYESIDTFIIEKITKL